MERKTSGAMITLIFISLFSVTVVKPAKGNMPSFAITPLHTSINLGEDEPLTVNVYHKSSYRTYSFVINVTGPHNYQSLALASMNTNATGDGNVTVNFPKDFFAYPNSPDTNHTGSYSVVVFQTSQSSSASVVAVSNFKVVSALTLSILRETGVDFLPGEPFELSVEVGDVNNQSLIPAQVTGIIAGTNIVLRFNSSTAGTYDSYYRISNLIPQDSLLTIYAQDALGNRGQTVITLAPSYNRIFISNLEATDQAGNPVTGLKAGQAIYLAFKASYPNGTQITSQRARVAVLSQSGDGATLQAQYSAPEGHYITTQSFTLPENSSSITLQVRVLLTSSTGIIGSSVTSPISLTLAPRNLLPLFILVPGLIFAAGFGVSYMTVRRTKRQLPLQEFRSALLENKRHSVLFMGKKKFAVNSLLRGLLREDLEHDVPSIYLNFELPTAKLISEMIGGGIDLLNTLQKRSLRIIDCSDLNSSLDLTTLRVRITVALSDIPAQPFSLYIDALTLLFEDLPTDQVVTFLWELSDEVILRQGAIYTTARQTKVIRKNLTIIRDAFDALFEITAYDTRSKQAKFMLTGVSQEMQRRQIGELKVAADSKIEMEVPIASSVEKKIKES